MTMMTMTMTTATAMAFRLNKQKQSTIFICQMDWKKKKKKKQKNKLHVYRRTSPESCEQRLEGKTDLLLKWETLPFRLPLRLGGPRQVCYIHFISVWNCSLHIQDDLDASAACRTYISRHGGGESDVNRVTARTTSAAAAVNVPRGELMFILKSLPAMLQCCCCCCCCCRTVHPPTPHSNPTLRVFDAHTHARTQTSWWWKQYSHDATEASCTAAAAAASNLVSVLARGEETRVWEEDLRWETRYEIFNSTQNFQLTEVHDAAHLLTSLDVDVVCIFLFFFFLLLRQSFFFCCGQHIIKGGTTKYSFRACLCIGVYRRRRWRRCNCWCLDATAQRDVKGHL